MNYILRRFLVITLLIGICRPSYALGDFVIPQTVGLIVGVPVAIALFWLVFMAALYGPKTVGLQLGRLLLIAALTTVFNIVYIWLIWVFDSATWSFLEVTNRTKQGIIYLLPTGIFVTVAVWRRWPYRAFVLAVSCLLVWLKYLALDS